MSLNAGVNVRGILENISISVGQTSLLSLMNADWDKFKGPSRNVLGFLTHQDFTFARSNRLTFTTKVILV